MGANEKLIFPGQFPICNYFPCSFARLEGEEGFRTYQEKMKKESFATVRLGFVFLLTGKFERKFSFKLLRLKCSKLFQKKKEKRKKKKKRELYGLKVKTVDRFPVEMLLIASTRNDELDKFWKFETFIFIKNDRSIVVINRLLNKIDSHARYAVKRRVYSNGI